MPARCDATKVLAKDMETDIAMSDAPGKRGGAAKSRPAAGKGAETAARRERQAAELRANLARRKQQAREKARLSGKTPGARAVGDEAPGDERSGHGT